MPLVKKDRFENLGPFFISEGFHKDKEVRDYHTHDCCEIGYVFQGSGHYHYLLSGKEKSIPIQGRTIALFSGNVPHRNTDPGDPLGQIIVVFDKRHFICGANRDLFDRFFNDEKSGPYIKTLGSYHARLIEAELRNVLLHTQNKGRRDELLVLNAFNTILWLLQAESKAGNEPEKEGDRVNAVIRTLEQNPVERLFLRDAAARVGLSERHFSTLFQKATGLSFYAYQLQKRMAYARDLVENGDKPISRIAFEAGFESLSSFNRQFQSHFDTPPSALRRNKGPLEKLHSSRTPDA
ncbi:MAG: helix-turn-helix domain-containing protein [Spirochaetia bacterium]|nr:helix-turn-helix domain-containing protein [Spirochaetia bacterium]